jgi:hypothetical protein
MKILPTVLKLFRVQLDTSKKALSRVADAPSAQISCKLDEEYNVIISFYQLMGRGKRNFVLKCDLSN